ncbi:TIGR03943 family putative permease subunit [Oryzobacter telluris]|uniref:TIGR03943 family putative permease subunit n=1 Tax=Oryzobacter telluris TaxID=3149179 RepID=UPI00370D796C
MRRVTQSGLLMVIGVIASIAAVNGIYLNFVKPSLRFPILAASLVLLLMGAYGVWEDRRHGPQEDASRPEDDGHGHDHARGPRIGWLLVVPFLLLGVVAPPPLGSYSAAEDSGLVTVTNADGLGALPPGDPVALTLAEFQGRALYDTDRSLENRRVTLVGFASPGRPGEWVLTRMSLNCCAADGFAVKVAVEDAPPVGVDEWVEVVGTWKTAPLAPEGGADPPLPVLVVEDATPIAVPENPYE